MERELSAIYLALAAASIAMWLLIAGRLREGRPLSARTASPTVPWSIWDVALVLAVWVVLEGAAGQASAGGAAADPTALTPRTMAALGVARLAWFAIAVSYLKLRAGATAADLGFDMARLKSDVPFGLQVFLAAVLPVYAIQWLLVEALGYESEHPLAKLVAEHSNVAVLALVSVVAMVIAPLVEEFLFRVLVQGWLEKQSLRRHADVDERPSSPGWLPIVISAALFGLLHWGHGPDPIALFVLALFLGYAYRQTHAIIAPLVIHVAVNALAIAQLWTLYFRGGA